MKIDVSELRKTKGRTEQFSGNIPVLSIELQGTEVNFRDIDISGNATNTGNSIYVEGKVKATGDCTCSLCLAPFPLEVQFPFEETYYRQGEQGVRNNGGLMRTYQGDEIDLSDVIREGLILTLPMKPLCRPDCKGLCPVCGCDLNSRQCSCVPQSLDPRLAVLKDFFKETNKN